VTTSGGASRPFDDAHGLLSADPRQKNALELAECIVSIHMEK
jgi:hypothetical protein